jgi:hypothetical protein
LFAGGASEDGGGNVPLPRDTQGNLNDDDDCGETLVARPPADRGRRVHLHERSSDISPRPPPLSCEDVQTHR